MRDKLPLRRVGTCLVLGCLVVFVSADLAAAQPNEEAVAPAASTALAPPAEPPPLVTAPAPAAAPLPPPAELAPIAQVPAVTELPAAPTASASSPSGRLSAPEPRKPVTPDRHSYLGVGPAFGVLNLPKFGVGLEVLSQLKFKHAWPVELGFSYFFANEARLDSTDLDLLGLPGLTVGYPEGGSGTTFTAAQFDAALCPYERPLVAGALQLCAGLYFGALHARSFGFIEPVSHTSPLYGMQAFARWHFVLAEQLGITYSVGLFGALGRDRIGYVARNGQFHEQFQMSPVGGRLDLALTYGF